jgi:endonuclease/exonuclease/phosphatase family metal-dependent hydrolase
VSLRLRLATFNLESLDAAPGPDAAFARRVSVLRPLLARLDADVLCLQEVNAQKVDARGPRQFLALDGVLAGTPYAGFARAHSVVPAAGRPSDVHNLVTLSRWPITTSRQVFHDIVAGWRWQPPTTAGAPLPAVDIAWDRPLLYCRIALPDGAPLHVVNLHLRAPRAAHLPAAKRRAAWRSSAAWAEGLFVAIQKRAGQALEARLLVERLFDDARGARIVVCGDLNADDHEMPTRLLQAAPDDIADPAFADRALAALESRLPDARRYSVVHAGRKLMLDHILVSPALASRCTGVEILNDGLVDETQVPADYAGSLHAPLVAAFDLTIGSALARALP